VFSTGAGVGELGTTGVGELGTTGVGELGTTGVGELVGIVGVGEVETVEGVGEREEGIFAREEVFSSETRDRNFRIKGIKGVKEVRL
jgi:hypothetical protein